MWRWIKYYMDAYKVHVQTSLAVAMSFRTSFVLLIFLDLVFCFTSIYSVDFIYNHVTNIGPWGRHQLLFFVAFMLAVDNLHMIFLSENFWNFSFKLRTGELDFVIMKPPSTIFQVFFRSFRPASLVNSLLIWFFLIHYGRELHFVLWQWLILPVLVLLAFILLAVIEFFFSTFMFWMVEGVGINFLRMQFQTLSRWPDFVYSYWLQKCFTFVIPIVVIGSAPTHFLLEKGNWHLLLGLIVAIVASTKVLFIFWDKGLKQYDSASS